MSDSTKSKKTQALIQLALFAGIVILLNILVNVRIGGRGLYANLDLTEEKRYTLSPATESMLRELDDVVFVKVLLEGDFPAEFKQLQRATLEILEDFRSVSPYIEFDFEDPSSGTAEEVNQLREQLRAWGLQPTDFRTQEESKIVYPFAFVRYGDRIFPVDIFEENVPGVTPDEIINLSISQLEYKLANAIQKVRVSPNNREFILFTEGHGELDSMELFSFRTSLDAFYSTAMVNLESVVKIDQQVKLVVVAKPKTAFSERDKFKLDQYVMNGGKVLWLMDYVSMGLDTLMVKPQPYYPAPYPLELDDLLFKYGIRFDDNFVLDYRCSNIPLTMGAPGTPPKFFRYPYHPVLVPDVDHPITKGLGLINLKYPSALDTDIQLPPGVERTVLLNSSENSMYQKLPVGMDFEFLRYPLKKEAFQKPPQPLAMLLEGEFPSFFFNRMSAEMKEGMEQLDIELRDKSLPTSMIIVADGDIARNDFTREGDPMVLGFNKFEANGRGYTFQGNQDFLINCVEYLISPHGVFEARGKEVKLRLLDRMKAEQQKSTWQLINVVVPVIFLALFGFAYNWWRRRKYAGGKTSDG